MSKLSLLFALCALGVANAVPTTGRIVGGQEAQEAQFPYQVSLRYLDHFHFCGGSIIGDLWIVTAAHCTINQNPSGIIVVVGALKMSDRDVIHTVRQLELNPNYNPGNLANDISLIKLNEPIQFNNKAQPIPIGSNYIEGGVSAVVSGWGQTSHPGNAASTLMYLNTRTEGQDQCDGYSLCTLTQQGQGICFGDSGGPLAVDGKLVGVVSAVYPCALGLHDIFTRVSYFRDWIHQLTGIN